MKVTAAHLAELRDAIAPFDTDATRERYRAGDFPRADRVKDLDTRYRWDLYWHATAQGHSLPDSTNGYNTAHIDTALRHVVPPL